MILLTFYPQCLKNRLVEKDFQYKDKHVSCALACIMWKQRWNHGIKWSNKKTKWSRDGGLELPLEKSERNDVFSSTGIIIVQKDSKEQFLCKYP